MPGIENSKARWGSVGKAVCLAMALWIGACVSPGKGPHSSTATVRILAFNDFHGQLSAPATGVPIRDSSSTARGQLSLPAGGAQYLAGLIAMLRKESSYSVVVAAGDLIGASPLTSAMFHDEPSIEVLSSMGLELSSVGNHEFDHGLAELQRMQQGGCFPGESRTTCLRGQFKGASFSYLAANVIDSRTGKTVFPAYSIKEFELGGGRALRIAFIGVVTKITPRIVTADAVKGLEFIDEADAVNALIPELRAREVDAIVVLVHEGSGAGAQPFDDTSCPAFTGGIVPIVERLDPAVDLVISGHTHKVYTCRRNGRLITSAGSQGQYLTVIDIKLDPSQKRVVETSAKQLAVVNHAAPNPAPGRYPTAPKSDQAQAIVDFYVAAARSSSQHRVARINESITRRPTPAGESALGDLIADAQLAETAGPEAAHAQIALLNGSGIRNDLYPEEGWLTYGALFAAQPFGNRLVTLTLTGEQLHAVLEHQWETGGSLLQVSSGFSYQWNPAAPVGAKVEIRSMRLNGVPIDPQGHYRVTVNDFLAGGGEDFTVLKAGTERTYGSVDVQALEKYLATHSPVSVSVAHRIVRREDSDKQ